MTAPPGVEQHRPPVRLSWRWLGLGGALVLSAVLGVALLMQSGSPACAASAFAAASGKATFYDTEGGGNCSFPGAPADRFFVALGNAEYAAAAACGGYLDVTGPKGKVRVKVTDRCPECAAGHIDLSREAFTRIADPVQGIVPVSYRTVSNPAVPGPLTFRIKEGASQYWYAVLVDNTGNAPRSVEAKGPGGSWRKASRTDYNYWIVQSGLGPGPYSIRVTDTNGRRATANGITMSPGVTQKTSVRMSGGGAAAPARSVKPSPSASRTTPAPSASPTVSATASASASAPVDGAFVAAGGGSGLGTRESCSP